MENQPSIESKYHYVYCPIISKEEIPFPNGNKIEAEFRPSDSKNHSVANAIPPHILREFHYEHKYYFAINHSID